MADFKVKVEMRIILSCFLLIIFHTFKRDSYEIFSIKNYFLRLKLL